MELNSTPPPHGKRVLIRFFQPILWVGLQTITNNCSLSVICSGNYTEVNVGCLTQIGVAFGAVKRRLRRSIHNLPPSLRARHLAQTIAQGPLPPDNPTITFRGKSVLYRRKETPLSDEQLRYPKWQHEFQEAVLELDREKLFEKIQKFETAIFVRLQELASDSDHHSEREAIADAVSTIAVVKKEKLSNAHGK